MTFFLSNRFFIPLTIIFALSILILPFVQLFNSYVPLEIETWINIFQQSSEVKNYIKQFAGNALLLLLLIFTLFGLCLIYFYNQKRGWAKPMILISMGVLLLGSMGSLLPPMYQKNSFYYISGQSSKIGAGKVIAEINFEQNKHFFDLLKRAEQGHIKCYMFTHLTYSDVKKPIKINDRNNFYDRKNNFLDKPMIEALINEKKITIELNLLENESLVYRDLPASYRLKTRTDKIMFNKQVLLNHKLLIYFKFEKLTGEPLAVFF